MFDTTEMDYCRALVATRGNASVGRVPSVVASYLRLQASSAFRVGDYESAARLGHAATQINFSADNRHEPRWADAELALGAVTRWVDRKGKVTLRRGLDAWHARFDGVVGMPDGVEAPLPYASGLAFHTVERAMCARFPHADIVRDMSDNALGAFMDAAHNARRRP